MKILLGSFRFFSKICGDIIFKIFFLTEGFVGFFFLYVLYSTQPPFRFHCFGGCWDRTQDCCDFGIGSQTRLDLIHKSRCTSLILVANLGTIPDCLQLKVNLKKKCLYVNSTTQRCQNKILKTFLIEDFFHFHLPPVSSGSNMIVRGLRKSDS
jgi:hypothetical protein